MLESKESPDGLRARFTKRLSMGLPWQWDNKSSGFGAMVVVLEMLYDRSLFGGESHFTLRTLFNLPESAQQVVSCSKRGMMGCDVVIRTARVEPTCENPTKFCLECDRRARGSNPPAIQ